MRYNRALLLLIPAISATFLVTDYNIFFASSAQARSQATIAERTDGSFYTISCLNDQPCQTFSSNQPSFVQPPVESTTIMQSVEETPTMQSPNEATADMQPDKDATEQYIEVPVEFCDDGLDNDDDSEVDEECGATTFSSALPNDLIDGEEHKQQLSSDGLEQPSKEYEHSDDEEYEHSDDESHGVSEEEEHEDEE
jgi:hypothetical protein